MLQWLRKWRANSSRRSVPPETTPASPDRVLVLGCGALASEVRAITAANGWEHVDFEYLPAAFHNRPEKIVPALEEVLVERASSYASILIGYGDCGTGGNLDRLLERYPHARRLPGDHCYAFFTGVDRFLAEHEGEIGTLYLTDYLVKHQDALIFGALGITEHPELLEMYFGNYTRLLYIAQDPTPQLIESAQQCANRLNLPFDQLNVGRGELETQLLKVRAV